MSDIKRYDIFGPDWETIENIEGDWVKYDDHLKLEDRVKELERVNNNWKLLVEESQNNHEKTIEKLKRLEAKVAQSNYYDDYGDEY